MKPVTDPRQVEQYATSLRDMMLMEEGREYEFNPDWVQKHNWKVIPVESMARIPVPDIPRIVSALKAAGYSDCVALLNEPGYIRDLPPTIASEPCSAMSTCQLLSIEEKAFREFNHQFGSFRSVLSSEDRQWAISCNEWYNLFGATPDLLTRLLGKPLEQARQEFQEFAMLLSTGNPPNESLLEVAKRYAVM